MYGKGAGGFVAGEFTMLHPDLITASISYSWGWWTMPAELDKPLDPVNSAPEFYMVLGMRDFTHHITTVRDTYERVKAKGYHVIYRELKNSAREVTTPRAMTTPSAGRRACATKTSRPLQTN